MRKKFFRVYQIKKVFIVGIVLVFAIVLMSKPQAAILSCTQALGRCGRIIVPSLFPFFVCSSLLVGLGFADYMTRFLNPIMKPLFNVPGSGGLALILGVLSGYAVGASTVASLRERNLCSREEGERMLAFCTNSGPLFILGSIGIGVFYNQTLGILLYVTHIIAAITVGFIFRFYKADRTSEVIVYKKKLKVSKPLSEIVTSCVKASAINIFFVCAFVIIFNVFVDLLILVPFQTSTNVIPSFLSGLFEVSIGAVMTGTLPILSMTQKLIMVSFLLGFGGFCVHFQVIGMIAKTDLSIRPYLIGKALCGAFSAIILIILLRFIPLPMKAFLPYGNNITYSPETFENAIRITFFYIGIAAAAMVVLYIITLIVSHKEK